MEADQPAGDGGGGGCGGFLNHCNFTFNEDDDYFIKFYNMQMSSEQNNKKVVELGSSNGSPQPMDRTSSAESSTMSAFTPFLGISDDLNQQPGNNLAPLVGESSSAPIFEGTSQTIPQMPTVEEFNQQQFQSNQSQPNGENSISSLLSNAPIFPAPETTFGPVLGAASQPRPPQTGGLNQENSTKNFLSRALAFPSYQSSNPALVSAQNERETPAYFSMPLHAGVTDRDGTIQPLHPQNNAAIQPYPHMDQLPLSLTPSHGTNTMMTGLGVVNHRSFLSNRQQTTLYPQQSHAASMFWPPSGSRPQGPQLLLNQPQVNQAQPSNTFGLQGHCSIQPPGASRPLGPQVSGEHQEVREVMMTQSSLILESSLMGRPEEVGGQLQQQLPEHIQTIPDVVVHSQRSNPVLIRPMPSLPSHRAHPLHESSGLSNSPVPFRFPPVQLDEIMNELRDGSSQMSVQFQNSPNAQRNAAKQRGKRCELGEVSVAAAKRSKKSSAASNRTEVERSLLGIQEGEVDKLSNESVPSDPRQLNCLYDPGYERIGLPTDPHLRLFQHQANKLKKNFQ